MADDKLKSTPGGEPGTPQSDKAVGKPEASPAPEKTEAAPTETSPAPAETVGKQKSPQESSGEDSGLKFEGDEALPHAGTPLSEGEEEEEEKKPIPWFWIIAGILFVLILVIGGLAWYANSQGDSITNILFYKSSSEEEAATETPGETPPAEEVPGEEEEVSSEFTGDYVTATLPANWTITEYTNGDGSSMLAEGPTYLGLTGLTVSSTGPKVVFTMESVYGIGGTSACEEYYEFPDSSEEYYQEVVDNSEAVGVTPTIVPISAGTYEEFNLFGIRVRRSGYNMYWDTTNSVVTFDAACGIDKEILTLSSPNFTADGDPLGNYQYTTETAATTTELTQLDDVLDSLVAL